MPGEAMTAPRRFFKRKQTTMRTSVLCFIVGLAALSSLPAETRGRQQDQGRPETPSVRRNMLVNGDFENGLNGWNPFWSRGQAAGSASLDRSISRDRASVRIEHRGGGDWSLQAARSLDVKTGEVYEYSGWVHIEGTGLAETSVVLRDAAGEVISWSYGSRSAHATHGWRCASSRFMIPPGACTLTPRVIGYGPAIVHVDSLALLPQQR